MKTTILTSVIGTGMVLAAAIALLAPENSIAQEKGAQKLLTPAPAPAVAAAPAMACASCKTEYTSRVDSTVRGAIKPAITTTRHLCGSCSSTVTTTGVGKAATTVASHSCSMSAKPANCCN